MALSLPSIQFSFFLPEILLVVGACFLALLDQITERAHKARLGSAAFILVIVSLVLVTSQWGLSRSTLSGLFLVDNFSVFFKSILLIITALTVLLSKKFLADESAERGEYYALVLLVAAGMLIMASAGDVLSMYLGLETMAIGSYILAAYFRSDERSSEAGLKYFLLGALNSGLILYGFALVYGLTGSLTLHEIRAALTGLSDQKQIYTLYLALVLIMSGFGFKIAAAPFHMWAPDVYEGAPTPVSAFLSAGSKTASFAVMLRLFAFAFGSYTYAWGVWLSALAALAMIIGNITALKQTNLKRLMAYSSIAHVGYMLMGFAAGSQKGLSAVMLYLLVYLFANLGIFAALVLVGEKGKTKESVADLNGLARRRPLAAFAILFFLLSLTGMPPTGGFIGKFYLFMSAVEAHMMALAIIGVLTSVISLFYYARIIVAMYMEKPASESHVVIPTGLAYAFSIMFFGVLITGLYPAPFFDLAHASLLSLLATSL